MAVGVDLDRSHVDERAGLDHGAAGTHQLQRLEERHGDARAVDHDIGAEATSVVAQRAHPFVHGRGGAVQAQVGAEGARVLEPLVHQVDSDQAAGTQHLGLGKVHQAERAEADHCDRVAKPEAAAQRLHRAGGVQAVGDGQHLGQRRQLGGQLVGHAKQARARQQVHALGPSSEQMRRLGAGERVAVVVESGAKVVRVALAQAEPAAAAGHVGRGHHPVADSERQAQRVHGRRSVADRLDHAHVLVAADDRVRNRTLVVGAGILQALTSPGVLVGTADAAVEHAQQGCPGRGVGLREPLDGQAAGTVHDRCADVAHEGAAYR